MKTDRNVIGFSALPVDDRYEGLHHPTRDKGLPARLVTCQVVEERKESCGKVRGEGVGHRLVGRRQGRDARSHQHRQEAVVGGGTGYVYYGIQSESIKETSFQSMAILPFAQQTDCDYKYIFVAGR